MRWLAPQEIGAVAWLDPDVAPAAAAALRLDSWVDFPSGTTEGEGRVTLVAGLGDGRSAVVVDRTPFHPLDHGWPDQPGDTGTLGAGDPADSECLTVHDSLTGALDDDGRLLVHSAIDVRRGDPSRTWVVAHVVDAAGAPQVGDRVHLTVDADTP